MQPSTTVPVPTETAAETLRGAAEEHGTPVFDYKEAFCRNLGLISEEEQEKLRNSRVAIAGMGGVGGIHLVTLARLGIGKFTIADPDTFELANMNRQYGCRMDTLGRSKVDVMAEEARRINPEVKIDIIENGIRSETVMPFLDGADLFVDGMDLFEMDLRRSLFQQSSLNEIYAITAAPMGFSVAWMNFAPEGPSFDKYFDTCDEMTELEKVISLIIGLAPRATHRTYLDLSYVNLQNQHGPSLSAACHLASGVIASQAVKILLGRTAVRVAPWSFQFDAYLGKLCRGRLFWGNRGVIQRLKRRLLLKFAARMNGG